MKFSLLAYVSGFLVVFIIQPSGIFSSQNSCPPKLNREKELKACLLKDYDKTVRPVLSTSKPVDASLNMILRAMELDEYSHNLNIHSWLFLRWTDEFLKWNPSQHDFIMGLVLMSDEIWNPDVSLLTTGDANMHSGLSRSYCHLTFEGELWCGSPITLAAHCAPDLTLWPFDTQTCTALMGSWGHDASALNLTLRSKEVTTTNMLPNKIWALANVTADVQVTTYSDGKVIPSLLYTFVIKRHAAGYAATVVVPAVVLGVITLLISLLEPESLERITLTTCSILGHILFFEYLSWSVPSNGDNAPDIVVFSRDSLLLVGASLVVTVFTRMLLQMQVSPPDWLTATIGSVLATQPGQLFLLGELSARGAAASASTAGEDGATLVSNDASSGSGGGGRQSGERPWKEIDDTWRLAAIFLDRLALSVFCIALVFLFGRYVA